MADFEHFGRGAVTTHVSGQRPTRQKSESGASGGLKPSQIAHRRALASSEVSQMALEMAQEAPGPQTGSLLTAHLGQDEASD